MKKKHLNKGNYKMSESNCSKMEPLFFLKEVELSKDEHDILINHLYKCKDCNLKYQEIRRFFETEYITDNRVQAAVMSERILSNIFNKEASGRFTRTISLRRYFRISLGAACLFFILMFSAGQITTLSKISKLEKKSYLTPDYSFRPNAMLDQFLVNHFFMLKDEKKSFYEKSKIRMLYDRSKILNSIPTKSLPYEKLKAQEANNYINQMFMSSDLRIQLMKLIKDDNTFSRLYFD